MAGPLSMDEINKTIAWVKPYADAYVALPAPWRKQSAAKFKAEVRAQIRRGMWGYALGEFEDQVFDLDRDLAGPLGNYDAMLTAEELELDAEEARR